jgi:hypothetical protein
MTTINWKTPSNGDWNVAANWSTNKVPTSADAVAISASAPYIVTISSVDQANSLTFGASQATLLENAGSLTIGGALTVNSGFVSLNQANTIGSVALTGGVLAVGNSGALGGGTIAMSGGELLGTANETLGNQLSLSGTSTIAAAHGTTLNENAPSYAIGANTTLNFGSAGQDGTVLWHTNTGNISFPFPGVTVQAGTLKGADGAFSFILDNAAQTTVDAGASIDLAGFNTPIADLTGGGAVIDSGGPATLTLGAVNFSGSISGPLSLVFNRDAALSGLEDFSGAATIGGTATVANAGEYDIVSNNGIAGTPASFFINNGLFEKTGGGGVSNVTSDFVNNGTITVTSGSVSFSGGFTNNGVIDGMLSESGGVWTVTASAGNAPPPAATTADMILHNATGGNFEIYDLGNNAILAAAPLQLAAGWQVAGLGGFNGTDTSDMMLRDNTGGLHVYDISNNNITGAVALGQVGLDWAVAGFGDFSSRAGETDMLMRNGNTGQFEIYDISNNAITSAAPMGQVGLEWSVAGFGDFSGNANETDMLMRNSNTGQFEIYDISNNQITSAAPMGQVGLEWSVAGFGDFSGHANETDMLMRNSNTGQFEIYDISNNQLTSAAPMGQVGLEWSVVGFGPINGAGSSDMMMRNKNTGAFEVYDIANNQLTGAAAMGQVGLEWSVAGVTADPPVSANAQLAQAMASYAADGGAVVASPAVDLTAAQPPVPSILTAATSQNPLPG